MNQIINTFSKLKTTDFSEIKYLTPAILSRKLKISQSLASVILKISLRSKKCRLVYFVRHPNPNSPKKFGPFVSIYNISKKIDAQTYEDEDEFIVTSDLIEKYYELL